MVFSLFLSNSFMYVGLQQEQVKRAQKGGTEVLEIRVKMTKRSWLSITNVYISPIGNVGFSTEMRLDTISTHGIIAGDFNGHSELWDDNIRGDERGEEILSWGTESNLTILNDGSPTRENPATGAPSLPDVTLAEAAVAMQGRLLRPETSAFENRDVSLS